MRRSDGSAALPSVTTFSFSNFPVVLHTGREAQNIHRLCSLQTSRAETHAERCVGMNGWSAHLWPT
eukprot:45691-Eustigmatos_ZCMA.PRE.1